MKTQRRWERVIGWRHHSGKQQHESRHGAMRQREGVRRRVGDDGLEVYRCTHCGFFHIGHGRGKR